MNNSILRMLLRILFLFQVYMLELFVFSWYFLYGILNMNAKEIPIFILVPTSATFKSRKFPYQCPTVEIFLKILIAFRILVILVDCLIFSIFRLA